MESGCNLQAYDDYQLYIYIFHISYELCIYIYTYVYIDTVCRMCPYELICVLHLNSYTYVYIYIYVCTCIHIDTLLEYMYLCSKNLDDSGDVKVM